MISIITPVYNGAPYIKETIDSVLNSIAEFDAEYIVINDGSTDSTQEILKAYGDKIILHSKKNGGESSAVNSGIELASGEIILIVSADDPLPSSEIFIGAETFFSENPEVVAWYPNWRIIGPNGEFIRDIEVEEYSEKMLIGRFRCLPGPGTLIRKSAAVEVGGRDTKWVFVGDYDFWLRLSRIGQLRKRPENIAQWRFHSDSTSISRRGKEMATERIQVIEEFLARNSINEPLAREARAHAHYFAARLSFFSPEVNGKKLLWKALRSNSFQIEDGNRLVYIFILLLPFSRILVRFLRPLLRRFGKALT